MFAAVQAAQKRFNRALPARPMFAAVQAAQK
mgnify:CR=1 FL=1